MDTTETPIVKERITSAMRAKFRTIINARRVQSAVSGQSRVQQNFKDEVDINRIVKKGNATGVWPTSQKQPMFGDFADAPSYHEALNVVIEAEELFGSLPSHVRKRFHNNPEDFLTFAHDPKNSDEMVKLGLAKKRERLNEREKTPGPTKPEESQKPDQGKKVQKKSEEES